MAEVKINRLAEVEIRRMAEVKIIRVAEVDIRRATCRTGIKETGKSGYQKSRVPFAANINTWV